MLSFLPVGTDQPWIRFPRVTAGIILLCVAVHVIKNNLDAQALENFHLLFAWNPRNWYNPIAPFTAIFIHADYWHLFFNMLFLIAFGPALESKLGSKNFLLLILLGGAAGSHLFSAVWHCAMGRDLGGIGFSGAVSAVMGAFVIRCYYARVRVVPCVSGHYIPKTLYVSCWIIIGSFLLKDIVGAIFNLSFFVPHVGYLAHIGGFLAGFAICLQMDGPREGRGDVLWAKIRHWRMKPEGKVQALFHLQELVRLRPQDAQAWLDLARVKARLGNREESREYYERAVRLFYQQKNQEKTVISVKEYFKLFNKPFTPRFQMRLNRLLELSGQRELARDMLSVALETWPELPGIKGAEYLRLKFRKDMDRIQAEIECNKPLRLPPRNLSGRRLEAMLFPEAGSKRGVKYKAHEPRLLLSLKNVWLILSSLSFAAILLVIFAAVIYG